MKKQRTRRMDLEMMECTKFTDSSQEQILSNHSKKVQDLILTQTEVFLLMIFVGLLQKLMVLEQANNFKKSLQE